ncbi:hypothetical protein HKD37_12G034162 [Glycine soja]
MEIWKKRQFLQGLHLRIMPHTHFVLQHNCMLAFTNVVNHEMKPTLIHLIQNNQFHLHNYENLYTHFSTFVDICITMKINHMPGKALRWCLFPFSLAGNAISWLRSFPPNSFYR